MEELIQMAAKALTEYNGFNEILLSDGMYTVHLVRFTPSPTLSYPVDSQPGMSPYRPSQTGL